MPGDSETKVLRKNFRRVERGEWWLWSAAFVITLLITVACGSDCLRKIVRIITETGLRVYKELAPMRKDQVDLSDAVVWISDSKTPNGIAEVPLTPWRLKR